MSSACCAAAKCGAPRRRESFVPLRFIAAGEQFSIIDLRHAMDFDADPDMIPGAIHLPVEQLARRVGEIPRDREIILCCT